MNLDTEQFLDPITTHFLAFSSFSTNILFLDFPDLAFSFIANYVFTEIYLGSEFLKTAVDKASFNLLAKDDKYIRK